jgi:hypothetical protein
MADLGTYTGTEEPLLQSALLPFNSYRETYIFQPGLVVSGNYKIEGITYNNQNIGVPRKVCVYDRTSDILLASTISDSNGFFSIQLPFENPVFVVCFPEDGEQINARIFDRVTPVQI